MAMAFLTRRKHCRDKLTFTGIACGFGGAFVDRQIFFIPDKDGDDVPDGTLQSYSIYCRTGSA